ncbi:MAG: undecaprenyl/decaprenyl-phosphate alpha-N-acetylglucosaminyl 1-phosphate transferase, partial [Syntrophorhabdaceae bacterium]|nr:undecaprenyl/decaprenyl-phosphate alpha-N-acetylglucosaminyl 1-phosphate transferase [Syntrophorhabdaceae bacterium]
LLAGLALDRFTLNWGFFSIFWTGALFAAGIGIVDDFKRVPSSIKLLIQVLAASIAFLGGVRIGTFGIMQMSWHFPLIASYLFTVFWFVLLINSINLIDGLDGLAAGVTVFGAAVMTILMVISGNEKGAIAFAALAGAILGFLRYNFNPAKIFMGDGGSYFLGYALACFSIQYGAKSQMGLSLLIPFLALGVPIFDVIISTVRRFITGNRIFKADKGHIHHRLLAMGLTTKRAVLILYGVSAVLALAALFLVNIRSEQSGFIFLFLGIAAIVFVRKLGYFEYLALDKLFGWLHDITDVSGFTHSRRAFLGLEINIRESKTLDEMWRHACTALDSKGFQRGYLVLNDHKGTAFPAGGVKLHPVGGPGNEGEGRMSGQQAWRYITKNNRDQQLIPPELKFEMTLPLLTKNNISLGILYLARDLQKNPFTTHTMRRIESLRRSLVIAIEKLETANKNQKRKEVDVKGVPKKTGSSAK